MTVEVRVSVRSLWQRFHGCTPDYIQNVCKGACCRHSDGSARVAVAPDEVWPLEQCGAKVRDGWLLPAVGQPHRCPFQGATTNLCKLHGTSTKPTNCVTDPFTLTRRDALVVRNRYRMMRCYRDDRDGPAPPAWLAFNDAIIMMFGAIRGRALQERLECWGDPHDDHYDGPRFLPWDMDGRVYQRMKATQQQYDEVREVAGAR